MNRVAVKELELIIRNFLGSKELKKMQLGDNYYKGKHDILNRVRKVIGQDGNLVPAANLPNNKIVDNMFANAVDQKTDYLLSKTPSLSSKNEKDIEEIIKKINVDNYLNIRDLNRAIKDEILKFLKNRERSNHK